MRTIESSTAFKRDNKREAKGRHSATLGADLVPVLVDLSNDNLLEPRHRDHDLSGDWAGYRECHVKPDLLPIYRKTDVGALRLARLGSHSELFGYSGTRVDVPRKQNRQVAFSLIKSHPENSP
jgi:mRNA interferase YafQ